MRVPQQAYPSALILTCSCGYAKLTIKGSGYVNTDLTESDGYATPFVSKVSKDSTYITSFAFQLQIVIN